MNVLELKTKIEQKLPPLAWQILGLKFFKEFMANKIKLTELKEAALVPDDLLSQIDLYLREQYKKSVFQL